MYATKNELVEIHACSTSQFPGQCKKQLKIGEGELGGTMYDTAGMHGYGYGTILRPENENNKLRNVLMPTTLSSHTRLLSELELSTRHLYLRM